MTVVHDNKENMSVKHLETSSPDAASDVEKISSLQEQVPYVVDPFNELAHCKANRALLRKQDLRLISFASMMYLLAYIDRSNIGNAKVMNSETKDDLMSVTRIDARQYSIALMVFLIAYTLFEVPANYFLKRMGPSKWFALLLTCWGTISMCMGTIKDYGGLTATRFLLGVFEAGLAPGLAYYVSFWYRADERSIRLALIYSTATLAGAFSGLLAYGISHMNHTAGLVAWRWLFLLEGAPSILFGIVVFFFLPDYPESAGFLTDEQRELAVLRMKFNGSKGTDKSMTWADAKAVLCDFRFLSLFAPSITTGLGYDSFMAQLMTVPPYAAAFVTTITLAFFCDKSNKRALTTIFLMLLGAAGFIASALLPVKAYTARYICLIIACVGTFATIPILLGWLSANLHSTSAQGLALALNISFGAPGQITGVWIYKAEEQKTGYPTGHWVNGGLLLMGACLTTALVTLYHLRNKRIEKGLVIGPKWAL